MNGYECSFYFAALTTSYLFNESTSLASRDTNIESWYHTTSRDFYRMNARMLTDRR